MRIKYRSADVDTWTWLWRNRSFRKPSTHASWEWIGESTSNNCDISFTHSVKCKWKVNPLPIFSWIFCSNHFNDLFCLTKKKESNRSSSSPTWTYSFRQLQTPMIIAPGMAFRSSSTFYKQICICVQLFTTSFRRWGNKKELTYCFSMNSTKIGAHRRGMPIYHDQWSSVHFLRRDKRFFPVFCRPAEEPQMNS